ncbi:MAG: vanillate O-demethylase monooxygenase subunit [Alcanivorax sp.]|jgi:vanillate O-demethylase monooxygenase subunit
MAAKPYPFLKNTWYAAAWDYEVLDGKKLARTYLEKPILIFKGESGKYIALDDRCCHRGAPLSLGRIEGDCVRCMYHGMKYDASGRCIEIPGQDKISENHRVHSYPIEERGHLLWIWMGDPELADPDMIHDFPYLTDPNWAGLTQQAYLHYDANWLLIVDNLADFSHLAFVHTNTLGGSEDYAFSTEQEVVREEDGFSFVRWDKGSPPPPYHKRVDPQGPKTLDRRNSVQMRVPGVFFMETTFAPVGWDPDSGDMEGVRQYKNCQYMTPETRRSTHFFWDYLRNYNLTDSNASISLRDSLLEGFMEDKIFIEEQQKYLELEEPFQPRGLVADKAFVQFRKVWAKKVEEELAAHPPEVIVIRNAIL